MRRFVAFSVLLTLACAAALASAAQSPQLPPHPRLLFNRAGIEQFKQKITQEPWRAQWAGLVADLDKGLKKKVELPPRGGNWSHNYVCPEHGARLKQVRKIGEWQWEHQCPVGPHILHGDPSKATLDFDGNMIAEAHGKNATSLRDLGLAWQVTGDRRYAEAARALLLAYAERYLTYPLHSNQGKAVKKQKGGARIASQPLTEASWLISVVQGADLIWDTLGESERETVAQKLFHPALDETILNFAKTPVIHNIQCRRNSAVGLVGLLLGDKALIDNAIDGIHGYRAQMAQGVQSDGVWCEGAWGYHFFTIEGLWPLTEAARNCGIDLYGPEFKRMFDAPLTLAMPNDHLPAFNDSGEVSIASRADCYELAYARYKDPVYTALLARDERYNRFALWFGEPRINSAALPKAGSRSAETSGYSILQRGDGPAATWLCIKYGPHGGGHGHLDKNNFVLYAAERVVMPDTGTHAYGSPLHKQWDQTSFAHNTLVVDQASQARATGKQLCFGTTGGVDYVMSDAGAIYPGVRFVRTAAMIDKNLVVFVDHVKAEAPHTLDLVCHVTGKWAGLPAGQPFTAPDLPGYTCLREATTRPGAAGMTLTSTADEARPVAIALAAGSEPTEVITGTGVGASTVQRVPLAAFRRVARETTYVWAASLDGSPVALKATSASGGITTVEVKYKEKSCRVIADCGQGSVKIEN